MGWYGVTDAQTPAAEAGVEVLGGTRHFAARGGYWDLAVRIDP